MNEKSFRKFHDQVSRSAGCDLTNERDRLPFAPDWLDSLAARIATGALVEATASWVLYRGNANHCEYAVHIYARKGTPTIETPLTQRDCALEIAWLRAGHPREWLDAPLEMLQAEAERRKVKPVPRTLISDAFIQNRRRGIIADGLGQHLALVPAPKVVGSTESQGRKGEQKGQSSEHQRFLQWAKVAHSPEFSELEGARSTVKRLNKFLLSQYKEWRKPEAPRTNGARSYKPSETSTKDTGPPPPDDSVSEGSLSSDKGKEEEVHPIAKFPCYARFKKTYPSERFDEAKAKPLFEGLTMPEQDSIIERLRVFLECARWQQSPQFIPMASTWLRDRQYASDPPPLLRKASGSSGQPDLNRADQQAREQALRIGAQIRKQQAAKHGK